jgi:DNA-directed RNA polymerase specialized sigma24 family protein
MAEQSVNEIAAITGISVANIKVKLFRSRMKLKEIIEQKFKQELID